MHGRRCPLDNDLMAQLVVQHARWLQSTRLLWIAGYEEIQAAVVEVSVYQLLHSCGLVLRRPDMCQNTEIERKNANIG